MCRDFRVESALGGKAEVGFRACQGQLLAQCGHSADRRPLTTRNAVDPGIGFRSEGDRSLCRKWELLEASLVVLPAGSSAGIRTYVYSAVYQSMRSVHMPLTRTINAVGSPPPQTESHPSLGKRALPHQRK